MSYYGYPTDYYQNLGTVTNQAPPIRVTQSDTGSILPVYPNMGYENLGTVLEIQPPIRVSGDSGGGGAIPTVPNYPNTNYRDLVGYSFLTAGAPNVTIQGAGTNSNAIASIINQANVNFTYLSLAYTYIANGSITATVSVRDYTNTTISGPYTIINNATTSSSTPIIFEQTLTNIVSSPVSRPLQIVITETGSSSSSQISIYSLSCGFS
jgi:hypothetical protein